jgi:glycosyltransferase involved in cell wall biosynthesis
VTLACPRNGNRPAAIIYGNAPGRGGLGHSVATGIGAVAKALKRPLALGPGGEPSTWSLPGPVPAAEWIEAPPGFSPWVLRYTPLRWRHGHADYLRDRTLGRWAANLLQTRQPQSCYLFTQIALEALQWCRSEGLPSVLDNPNGHIRNYWEVSNRESRRWFGTSFHGHPSAEMVERIEEEYRLADRIRVYSNWGKASMVEFGVPEHKIQIVRQVVNLQRFRGSKEKRQQTGPLRVCYVGSLELRKGFVYLLEAIRAIGAKHIHLRMVGATGNRDCAKLLERKVAGLPVEFGPGDPVPIYQESDLFVLPTLEDGLPFVLLEALGCELPVIVTSEAGAAECVRPNETGWVVPPADVDALAGAFEQALIRREDLPAMGSKGRADVEQYAGAHRLDELSQWFYNEMPVEVCSRN